MLKSTQKTRKCHLPFLLSGLLLICAALLSACSSFVSSSAKTTNAAGSTPTLVPSPTVTLTLQQQGTAQLQTFQQWIALMQQYSGKVSTYQQQYTRDQQALNTATTDTSYQSALAALNGHVTAIKIPALRTEALSLHSELVSEANTWANTHTYYDSYDGVTYNLGYEYQGIVNYPSQGLFASANTISDYQYLIGQLNIWQTNFNAYKTNFSDKTAYDQVHATDTHLIKKYGDTSGMVLVVSFSEQALRVYQNGKLIKAFLIVSGQPDHPSLPGAWWIEQRLKDIKFTSGKKPGQEGYYPDTPIAFALLYHSGGYYFHQSWWRSLYGADKQFPHLDPGGTAFAVHGSHGCINMSTADVTWLYNNATVNSTKVIMY
ncbi:MAG TPA: L,D-transpeptidase [Ktedonobacteraceae bacterium]